MSLRHIISHLTHHWFINVFILRYLTGRDKCRLIMYTSFNLNEVNVCVPTVLSDFHSISMNCYINGITRWLTVGVNFVTYVACCYRLWTFFAHCTHMENKNERVKWFIIIIKYTPEQVNHGKRMKICFIFW